MAAPPKHIAELIYRHLNGSIAADQLKELQAWTGESPENKRFLTELMNEPDLIELIRFNEDYEQNDIKSSLYTTICSQIDLSSDSPTVSAHPDRAVFLWRWWVAASVILILGVGAFLWTDNKKNTTPAVATINTGEILPGKDGAILTLADGSQVLLDSLGNGLIAHQTGADVSVINGRLTYQASNTKHQSSLITHNSLSTPKGRQFHVTLPDGTNVWLNAASSLRYPTVFTEKERHVEVTGEAYFEVAKNEKMPFRVSVKNIAQVEVLGTHFNVNAYENEESIHTTLLEGSLKVNGTVIRPGQQAQLSFAAAAMSNSFDSFHVADALAWRKLGRRMFTAPIKIIDHADTDKVMAWKKGLFNFNGLTFVEIMRQLERWYDIKVVYKDNKVPNKHLIGKMTRGVSLNSILEHLENIGVNYNLKDRTLVVLP